MPIGKQKTATAIAEKDKEHDGDHLHCYDDYYHDDDDDDDGDDDGDDGESADIMG